MNIETRVNVRQRHLFSFIFMHTRRALIWTLLLGSFVGNVFADESTSDRRPPFDKSEYAGTVWSAANPWFPINLSRTHQVPGGPDHSWWRLSEDPVMMWRQVAERIKPYGMSGLQLEVHCFNDGRLGWDGVLKQMLEGFELAGNGAAVQAFVVTGTNLENTVTALVKLTEILRHPSAYRLDGRAVLVVYTPQKLSPDDWQEVIERVEQTTEPVIWLFSAAGMDKDMDRLRQYVRVFDGISGYLPTGASQAYLDKTAALMAEYPGKVFEGTVGQTYFVHFHYGGIVPNLTQRYRESWQRVLAAKPDSVTLCNFFDIYENSRMFPSYQSEDILLRIAQFEIARWRGQTQAGTTKPDIYVANPISTRLGAPVDFEVIGFPLADETKDVEVVLEICNERGDVLHRFEPRTLQLDTLRVEHYTLDSLPFASQRGLCPRLITSWKQDRKTSDLFPHTSLVTAMRPNVMYWARSLKRMTRVNVPGDWRLDGQGLGGTVVLSNIGPSLLEGRIMPIAWEANPLSNHQQELPRYGSGGIVKILRNGRELESFTTAYTERWHLNFVKPVDLPEPGGALDWYNIELENPYGGEGQRYLSPPIWVVSGSRNGLVTLPVLDATGSVQTVSVEAARVPFFHYPCDRNTAPLLLDVSGYGHHGYIGGEGYGGGHLGHTGYQHEHTPLKGVSPLSESAALAAPRFITDADGEGCLRFDGSNFTMIQGGTAFPLSCTYETQVKVESFAAPQQILGAANQSIVLSIDTNGILEVRRGPSKMQTTRALSVGQWHRIAAVYDLRELRLYLDGALEASIPVPPEDYLSINAIVLGGGCAFPFIPRPSFKGCLRQVRFYGRNLSPDEFLPLARSSLAP